MENKHLEEVLDALGSVIAEQKSQISVKNWQIADLTEKLEKAEARVKELEAVAKATDYAQVATIAHNCVCGDK